MSPAEPHLWKSVTEEVGEWMDGVPDQIATSIIGEHRPFEADVSQEDALTYHLEHLHPAELGYQFDPAYLGKIMATSTRDEQQSLAHALDRRVQQKADEGSSSYRMPPARPPRPPRRY